MPPIQHILQDNVTTHMRRDPSRLRSNLTVSEAIERIRQQEIGGRVVYFFVIDDNERLIGVVPTRRLLRSKPDVVIADIMVKQVITIHQNATILEACEFFALYRLLAFPVVDDEGKLIGLVDIDLYTEELEDFERYQEGQDLFQLVGVHLSEAEQRRVVLSARKRFPWLMCNVVGGMIAALISDAYENVATLALVTPFIALVTGMAEGVTIQSVSLSLQMMHGQKPTWNTLRTKVGCEAIVGLMLGLFCGFIVGCIAFLWRGSFRAGMGLFAGIAGGVAASAAIGAILPYLLRMFRRDPRLASGPIALALSDMVTLIWYFNLCRWLLL